MKVLGEVLKEQRKKKHVSLNRAATDLLIKKEHLEALEDNRWDDLPEPTFVKGFLKTYSNYLGLDNTHVLAIYRRDFDESKFHKRISPLRREKRRFFLTPTRIINIIFGLAIFLFIVYISATYSSILSAPKLQIISPSQDQTTTVPVIEIVGKTDAQATVSIAGEFVQVDSGGNFSKEFSLSSGKNTIEIIASKRLSPKTKVTRTIRFLE